MVVAVAVVVVVVAVVVELLVLVDVELEVEVEVELLVLVLVLVLLVVAPSHVANVHPPSTTLSFLYQQGGLLAIGEESNMLLDAVLAAASNCQQLKSWSNFEAS